MAASSCCSRGSSRAACTNGGSAWRPCWRGVSMLLSAQNVSKSFGSFLAVRGADLAVAEGEIIGLIGPNGAGKSTFFNCLAGDTVPTMARVLATGPRLMLLDEALAGLTPAELQQAIALVRRIHELGVTLVIVEHIMEVIMTLAQRVLVFNQGHVIAHGKPREIVANEAVIEAYLGRGHRRRGEAP